MQCPCSPWGGSGRPSVRSHRLKTNSYMDAACSFDVPKYFEPMKATNCFVDLDGASSKASTALLKTRSIACRYSSCPKAMFPLRYSIKPFVAVTGSERGGSTDMGTSRSLQFRCSWLSAFALRENGTQNQFPEPRSKRK